MQNTTLTTGKHRIACGRIHEGEIFIVSEADELERWHTIIANEIDATPVDGDIPDFTQLGGNDSDDGIYLPPHWSDTEQYDAYVKAWNNAWAKREGKVLTR